MQDQPQLTIDTARRLVLAELEGDRTGPGLIGIEAEAFAMTEPGPLPARGWNCSAPPARWRLRTRPDWRPRATETATRSSTLAHWVRSVSSPGPSWNMRPLPDPPYRRPSTTCTGSGQRWRAPRPHWTGMWWRAATTLAFRLLHPAVSPGSPLQSDGRLFPIQGPSRPRHDAQHRRPSDQPRRGRRLIQRRRVANLLSPLLTATFSSSATPSSASRRAQTWQVLDPTRTGFPDLSRRG